MKEYTDYGDKIDTAPPKEYKLTVKELLESQDMSYQGIPKKVLYEPCLSFAYENTYEPLPALPDGTVFRKIAKTNWKLVTENHIITFESNREPWKRAKKTNLNILPAV